MTEMSVRKQAVNCKVSGCKAPAVVEVYWYKKYPELGHTYCRPYWQCPYLCEEHLYINESGRTVCEKCTGVTAYPFVNKTAYVEGYCLYKRLCDGLEVDVNELPHVQVEPALMPPPLDPNHLRYRPFDQIANAVYMLGNPKRVDQWQETLVACT